MKKQRPITVSVLLLAVLLCAFFLFAGCSAAKNSAVSVTGIESVTRDDGSSGYKITYSDGTTALLPAGTDGKNGANGRDGENGKSVTVDDLFTAYKENVNPNATMQDFLSSVTVNQTTDSSLVVNSCLRSAVSVYSEFIETTVVNSFYGITSSNRALSAGSGVIYDIDDDYVYVITNYHVIYDKNADPDKNGGGKTASMIRCYLFGSESTPERKTNGNKYVTDSDGYYVYDYKNHAIDATLVGGSATADVAVLRMDKTDVFAVNDGVKEITFAENYSVGQSAIAIGNAEGEGISVTEGIVSVDNENIVLSVDGTQRYHRSMRIDTPIYHGNSGGGLFDQNGNLIGLTNAGDEEDQNINYAIPLPIVENTVENIMYYYRDGNADTVGAYKTTVGVSVDVENVKYVFDSQSGYGKVKEDIIVKSVEDDSVALRLGLAKGDKLTAIKISGRTFPLYRSFDISDAMLTARKTDTVAFEYVRGDIPAETAEVSLSDAVFSVY